LLIFYSSFTHLSLSLFYFIQFLYQHYGHQLDLRSFPTRRSSDLQSEGLDDEMLARQVAVVGEGVAANRQALDDPLKVLSALGGLELAANVGAIIACRLARIPVILDGFVSSAAAAVLHAVEPQLLDHCLVAQRRPGPGHARLLEKLDKSPLVDLELGVEEGVGAALAIQLLQAAAVCHNSMATWRTA